MENLIRNWFLKIERQTKEILGSQLNEEELKSIDEFDKLELGEHN
ncbi:MAG TPA: hypothetical protein VMZ91_04180 [Candidatus Paceibacterota bacterium]|nr:hypothetical protein [Candidatus Paceibacterota bacterium]